MTSPQPLGASSRQNGAVAAIATYTFWGVMPIYFKLLGTVPAPELLAWRIIWSMPICLAIIAVQRQNAALAAALRDRAVVLRLMTSALLTCTNSLIFFIAVVTGHVLATSLGYYIMPLVNVLIGTVFLHEKLSRTQWSAVALAATGIGLLAFGELDMLLVSLALGVTYALYGFVRKVTPVGALEGVTIETGVSLIPALAVAGWYAVAGGGSSIAISWQTTGLLMIGGLFTAIPLLLFGYAARRLTLSAMGFAQFITPSIGFLLGHFLYGEPLDAARTGCFLLIWAALALFTLDMFHQARLNSHTKFPA
ncbi:EamA family transporter RarD [Novosphingobium sp.]|uniref:EamA family transporter RarD n=1 Tax=Novosphingobium sp. TaxID=1874826 RepID=UPI003BABD13B